MWELFRYAPLIALGVSILAFVLSAFSLGWNIYRDVILKPRLKVALGIKSLLVEREKHRLSELGAPFIELQATNHGPGEIVINGAVARRSSFLRSLFTECPYLFIVPDFKHPYCSKPSCRVAVGDKALIIFPYQQECFLAEKPKRVGVVDSYGRVHWASRRELRNALQQYRESFLVRPAEKSST